MRPIYLDYNATTPVDPAVFRAMLPYLGDLEDGRSANFGNPSSSHWYGRTAHAAVDQARSQAAGLIGAHADEIVFTSGGTEASNHAIQGAAFAKSMGASGRQFADVHIITSAVEHPATLQPCALLRRLGCRITIVPVDRHGCVNPEAVRAAIDRQTMLISIMHANNEVGSLQPIREIAACAREQGVLVHTDAAQSLGKIPVNVDNLGVDLLSAAGHKIYAPKGVGFLYIRRGVQLESLLRGAGHESGRRAGTENVPSIVALGAACAVAGQSLLEASQQMRLLRDRLWDRLHGALGDRLHLNGHPEQRLPNTLNVSFLGWNGAEVLQTAVEVAASTGSACHEGRVCMSPVLEAMGASQECGRGAVRFSVGRFTTADEIDQAANALLAGMKGPIH